MYNYIANDMALSLTDVITISPQVCLGDNFMKVVRITHFINTFKVC